MANFSFLIIIAFLGIIIPTGLGIQNYSNIVPGDTAWMMTATGLVLLMTPRLAFFYGGMMPLRISSHGEKIGLDLSQHDESYDFVYKE